MKAQFLFLFFFSFYLFSSTSFKLVEFLLHYSSCYNNKRPARPNNGNEAEAANLMSPPLEEEEEEVEEELAEEEPEEDSALEDEALEGSEDAEEDSDANSEDLDSNSAITEVKTLERDLSTELAAEEALE